MHTKMLVCAFQEHAGNCFGFKVAQVLHSTAALMVDLLQTKTPVGAGFQKHANNCLSCTGVLMSLAHPKTLVGAG